MGAILPCVISFTLLSIGAALVGFYVLERPFYCWTMCVQLEISCLTTVSYTFGLVPATTLSAASAVSGCLASFDICELSCAKRSNLKPFSMESVVSDSCEIFRNGIKISAKAIKDNSSIANPYNLDADCRKLPELGATVPPITSVPATTSVPAITSVRTTTSVPNTTSVRATTTETDIRLPRIRYPPETEAPKGTRWEGNPRDVLHGANKN